MILLLFGAPKLPALARSLGQSMKILKSEVRSDSSEAPKSDVTTDTTGDEPQKPVS
ncbi:sec-independent protein translocase protein TatA [Agromyces atrinae]|uniref:Sec-independent protein translocase protein TatA n=1 Tax=Agromyces atrinae TaxID=592376 RepID=A0A852SJ75_9MICO|nr:sec-independent protein translocase protein TatA [Agromyces atrinae]